MFTKFGKLIEAAADAYIGSSASASLAPHTRRGKGGIQASNIHFMKHDFQLIKLLIGNNHKLT